MIIIKKTLNIKLLIIIKLLTIKHVYCSNGE